jgi:hypothetical protein
MKHDKHQGKYRNYTIPVTTAIIQRGTVGNKAVSIDGVLYLDAGKLMSAGLMGALAQNWHDFRGSIEEPTD